MQWRLGLYTGYLSSILFGDTMAPNIEQDSILFLGYSILYKEYNLTRSNHLTKRCSFWGRRVLAYEGLGFCSSSV